MPLPLLSRPIETIRAPSPSLLATPPSNPAIPTIRLVTATPSDPNTSVAPWSAPTLAPKPPPSDATPRKRLVPKKSKLGILSSRETDLSDVVRRVGATHSNKNATSGIEIYVDPTHDSDIAEIVMVKKKKSRVGLDGMRWGPALGEVTNVPHAKEKDKKERKKDKENTLKVKLDEKSGWWSIGRGRKDSKEKYTSKSPSTKDFESHDRFNSLDSGVLLNSPVFPGCTTSPIDNQHLRVPTPPSATLMSAASGATLAPSGSIPLGSGKDSVALRAIRSVRSLARIGSWAQLKNTPAPDEPPAPIAPIISEPKKKKKKKDKERHKEKERDKSSHHHKEKDRNKDKDRAATVRYSGSSFEAGALTASPERDNHKSLSKKKSILGLGLPSTMRLPGMRSGSTASSIVAAQALSSNMLSVETPTVSGCGILSRARSGSTNTASSAGSVRPGSLSGSSIGCSVRWDEAGLETVKEARKKERALKKDKDSTRMDKNGRESRKSSDSRKRTPLAAVFPGELSEREEVEEEMQDTKAPALPIVTVEEATVDGHSAQSQTPIKRARPRPMSEMLLGRSRPKAMYEDETENPVISLLDAATNDLALLINRLDLEATPDMTPMSRRSASTIVNPESGNSLMKRRMTLESPVKVRTLRAGTASVSSLRPYAKTVSRVTGPSIGLNIAPWATLNAGISPATPSPSPALTFKPTHKRTLSPAPAAEPEPVFKPLRPAKSRVPISGRTVFASAGAPFIPDGDRSPSAQTFGSAHSKSGSRASLGLSPVFKKAAPGHQSKQSYDTLLFNPHPTIGHPALPSPGLPPEMPLPSPVESMTKIPMPVFRAKVIDEDDHHVDIEEAGGMSSEDDTKKSFDFTGELQKLNESGGSDRLSFVEQLENAFRTPGKIDLRYDFLGEEGVDVDASNIPSLQAELERTGDCTFNLPGNYVSQEFLPQGFPMDVDAEPSLLPGTDSFAATNNGEDEDFLCGERSQMLRSMNSRPSDGQLNRDFKFGGKPSHVPCAERTEEEEEEDQEEEPLTLSDIIPPSTIANSLSNASFSGDETAVLNSIFAKAIEIPSPPTHHRLHSDSSSKRYVRMGERTSNVPGHYRHSSELSFAGFDSFAEVRRGFEFHDHRPNFYPPPGSSSGGHQHNKHESMFSIASISSYGQVINNGSVDPFEYGTIAPPLPSLRERPSSDEFSFSMSSTLDDTFSFIHRQARRRRVNSDASSFYFRASVHSQMHPYNRVVSHHRRHESTASGASFGPPISLYNRSYSHHRRSDSSTSMSSVAQSYVNGGGRAAWARHRPEFSGDSVLSDFSMCQLGRPGLGDKMLDSALDHGIPLAVISASPPESPAAGALAAASGRDRSDRYDANRMSYDSIMGSTDREAMARTMGNMSDSLFEKTCHRMSVVSSDSTFFGMDSSASHGPPQFRPVSSYSIASIHSPPKEDDTMISMLGGGHVRRRSVGSMIEASPCRQAEKRKHITFNVARPFFCPKSKQTQDDVDVDVGVGVDDYESPKNQNRNRVIESKPSIASTSNSMKFGDERMIRAKHGLLERRSLENTVLIAEGEEDMSTSFRMPVFTRPSRAGRSRSSTCTSMSMSSGSETPPLSISDGYSSLSEGSSQSSIDIDLSHVNYMLSNVTHPLSNATMDRVRRPCARGHGHRRRISQARASRTSIYETIEEELTTTTTGTTTQGTGADNMSPTLTPQSATKTIGGGGVYVVDSDTASVDSISMWDDEKGVMALRKYYALRDEAHDTVTESKRVWLDTPFSVFAVQSFDPPRQPGGMKALLEHSRQNYGPLPSDLRSRRTRTRSRVNSRASPYPKTIKTTGVVPKALQQISVNPNIGMVSNGGGGGVHNGKGMEAVGVGKGVSPGVPERNFGPPPRPRVGSAARRAALGWSKRSSGRTAIENKENANANGSVVTPSDSLRLNRPRPRGRPTPATTGKPIRV